MKLFTQIKYSFFSLRPTQWIKNTFIFLPLIFGGKLFSFPANLKTGLAFILFSMAASSTYLMNDIEDLERDKFHRTKRLRPIASGKVSVKTARVMAFVLGSTAIFLSMIVESRFGLSVAFYFVLNWLYNSFLKHIVILDVFCLASFYLLRVVSGTFVAQIGFSHWMIFTTFLLAMFLGFNKRRQELIGMRHEAVQHRPVLAGYNRYFIDQMISVLTASIVVVYMLYTVDERTVVMFGTNHLTYSIPCIYYGIFRYLYLVHKKRFGDDPTRVVLSDFMMQANLIVWILICVAVIYFRL